MAATRISGIVFGVFLSLLLCVVVFPKSATHEAVDNLWHAMTDLSALHALAWSGGRHEGPPGAHHHTCQRPLQQGVQDKDHADCRRHCSGCNGTVAEVAIM